MTTTLTLTSDIKFFYENNSLASAGPADAKLSGSTLYGEPGLENAVLISIGSNARAEDHDALPQGFSTRGGWFGTSLEPRMVFSKAWLLGRSKIDETTLRLYEQYNRDALQWMIDDGIAASIEVVAVRGGMYQVNLQVLINRAEGDRVRFKYFANWENQTIGGLI